MAKFIIDVDFSAIFSTILLYYRQIFILRQFCFEIFWKICQKCYFLLLSHVFCLLDQKSIRNNSHVHFFLYKFDSWDQMEQFWHKNHQNRISGFEVTPFRVNRLITTAHSSKYISLQIRISEKFMNLFDFPWFHRITTIKSYNFDI